MTLKMTTKTVFAVDAYDFEQFVREHGGKDYSFQADEECADDSDHEYHVDGDLDDWDMEKVNKTLTGGYDSYVTRALLNHFANENLIPRGNYLISLY